MRRDRVAPFTGEGHAVQRWDVEDEEVAGAGVVELLVGREGSAVDTGRKKKAWGPSGKGLLTCSSRSPYIAKRLE